MKAARLVTAIVMAISTSACASALERMETAKGPNAYWINSVPPDVAKMEAEDRKNAFYNQPGMRLYLRVVPLLPLVLAGVPLALPTYVPPVVP